MRGAGAVSESQFSFSTAAGASALTWWAASLKKASNGWPSLAPESFRGHHKAIAESSKKTPA
jgi:hypothetical protein